MILSILYIAGYYAVLFDRKLGRPFAAGGPVTVEAYPVYRWEWVDRVAGPAHQVDRLVRPRHWRLRVGDPAERVVEYTSNNTTTSAGGTLHVVSRGHDSMWIETRGGRIIDMGG